MPPKKAETGFEGLGSSGDIRRRFTGVYKPKASKPTKLTKVERDYLKGTGNRPSAHEAIKRARRANRQPPPRG